MVHMVSSGVLLIFKAKLKEFIMLSNQFKQSVTTNVTNTITLDRSSKELFNLAHNEFYKVSNEALPSLRKEINEYLDANIVSNEVKASIKRVMTVAYKYSTLKLVTYLDKLTYDNIKGAVSLMHYMSTNNKEELSSVKRALSRVKGEGIVYNNNFRDKVRELRAKYKVVATEDGELIKVSPTKLIHTVQNNLDNFNHEQILELLALVQSKVS